MQERRGTAGLTVIIPVYNGQNTIRQCLEHVYSSTLKDFEVIVVDDHSTDGTARIVCGFPCVMLRTEVNSGAAAARNLGASHASSPLMYFLDADILIEPDTLEKILEEFEKRPEVCAIFGSFQKNTLHQNFVSVYKNLLQHYTHQNSNEDSTSFCGGFSLIRRDVFLAVGGLDPAYRFLEDVELGYRLHQQGYRVRLLKNLQVTHCKRFTLAGLAKSDVFERAIPWTRIMLSKHVFRNDLNTRVHNVLSVPVSWMMLASVALPSSLRWVMAPLIVVFLILNRGFLGFVLRERGLWFASRAAALCWFGYLYSAVGAAIGASGHMKARLVGVRQGREHPDRIDETVVP